MHTIFFLQKNMFITKPHSIACVLGWFPFPPFGWTEKRSPPTPFPNGLCPKQGARDFWATSLTGTGFPDDSWGSGEHR